ncbi:transcriptional regulator [Gallaecimonas sp. GXIMD4217]|uniref:transcriptional regulator n=1 Tax=Gallaecimonas sp. GXIMD4217 TaxID=3131927 RepID=UPI00311B4303
MSDARFDNLIHAPNRLQICALLEAAAELEFMVLREQLGVSDSVLSKHVKALEEAGYLSSHKRPFHGRPRTWIALTPKGRQAYLAHVEELKRIVGLG